MTASSRRGIWLARVLPRIASAALRIYYRLHSSGGHVPRNGPVLLVANHPNSLLDPGLVAVAARRRVRFLAKSQLFTDPLIGWLVRGTGSIPVYRRKDDPGAMSRNEEMFRAVQDALGAGDAVGIFPEGVSHNDASLAPLKTGAARIALGTFARHGVAFPIVPVGLSFREKSMFRSDALVVTGPAVTWADLSSGGADDIGAVMELTRRIDDALRDVTVNLERWDDAPLVEYAESIYSAEFGAPENAAEWVGRLRAATDTLRRARRASERWVTLAAEVSRHFRVLDHLGLRPSDLTTAADAKARVTRPRLPPVASFSSVVIIALGTTLFWLPYRLTAVLEKRARPDDDMRATYKLLTGAVLFPLWILVLTLAAASIGGGAAAVSALLALPALAIATVNLRERRKAARRDLHRFRILESRADVIAAIREDQRDLAGRLRALYEGETAEPQDEQ